MIRCPYCGYQYESKGRGEFYVCPYCGGVTRSGELYHNVYIFKNLVDKSAAFRKILNFAPLGSPEDLHTSTLINAELHFIPLYLYRVIFTPLEITTYTSALALSKKPIPIPEKYQFPTRWRTPYKPSLDKAGVFHNPDVDPERALPSNVLEEAAVYEKLFKTRVKPSWHLEGIVYYPLWRLDYKYVNIYRATVDATDGTVLYMEYPLSRRGRLTVMTQALGTIASASVVGALMLSTNPQLGALGGALASLGAVVRLVTFAAARRGKYII